MPGTVRPATNTRYKAASIPLADRLHPVHTDSDRRTCLHRSHLADRRTEPIDDATLRNIEFDIELGDHALDRAKGPVVFTLLLHLPQGLFCSYAPASTAVYWQGQELEWLRRAPERREQVKREIERTVKRHPKVAKEYLAAQTEYRTFLKLAVEAASRGLFSPESVHLIEGRIDELRQLHDQLMTMLSIRSDLTDRRTHAYNPRSNDRLPKHRSWAILEAPGVQITA